MTPENQEKLRKFSGAKQLASLLEAYTARSTAEKVVRFIPLIGSVIEGRYAFSCMYNFLDEYLNELEEVALAFVEEVNANTVGDFDID